MSAVPKDDMTVDEFLVWAAAQPKEAGRFELVDGRVVPRGQAERVEHTNAKGEFFALLRAALRGKAADPRSGNPCRTYVDGPTVRISPKLAFRPDGLIYCGPPIPDDSLEINDPVLVFEVLSPSTQRVDSADKLIGYFSRPAVMHYVLVNPVRRALIHHRRIDPVSQNYSTTILHAGQVLSLDPPGIEIDVAAIFA